MFEYDFMVNALVASACVAVLAGAVGYMLVLRGQTFAGHAMAHVGFAGATGSALIGIPPFLGFTAITVCGGVLMGLTGERLQGRDVGIGIVLAFSLGAGLLFLHFYTAYATQITALLFGNVLGVERRTLYTLAGVAVLSLACLAAIGRPLLFASLQPEVAEASGVNPRLISALFLAIAAMAVAESAQIVGVLLVFSLMVGPAATAQRLAAGLWTGLGLSVLLALVDACAGVALAFYTDLPTSFWITSLATGFYLASLLRRS
jgi:zinc/manganese transport system permease protein